MRRIRISYRLILLIIIVTALLFSTAAHSATVQSASIIEKMHYIESEDNNSLETAGDGSGAFDHWGLQGNLESMDDKDYFKFTLSEATMLQFKLINEYGPYNAKHWNFTLFRLDEEGVSIPYTNTQFGEYEEFYMNPIRLSAGDYYFLLDCQGEACEYTDAYYYLQFYTYTHLVGQDKYEQEFNDTIETALPIKLGNEYSGNFNSTGDIDYYTFTLTQKMNIIISSENIEKSNQSFQVALLTMGKDDIMEISSFTSAINTRNYSSIELEAGSYYLKLKQTDKELIYPDYRIKVAENKPSVPTKLAFRYSIMDGITLSWEEADEAMAYYIYRSAKKSSGYRKLGIVTDNGYIDRCFIPGKTYYYKVKAINRDLYESSFSKVFTVKTQKEEYPPYWRSISISAWQTESGVFEKLLRNTGVDRENLDVNYGSAFYYTQEPNYRMALEFGLYDHVSKGHRFHVLKTNVKNDNTLYIAKQILEYYYPTDYEKVLKPFMKWYINGTSYTGTFDSRQFECSKSGCYIGTK